MAEALSAGSVGSGGSASREYRRSRCLRPPRRRVGDRCTVSGDVVADDGDVETELPTRSTWLGESGGMSVRKACTVSASTSTMGQAAGAIFGVVAFSRWRRLARCGVQGHLSPKLSSASSAVNSPASCIVACALYVLSRWGRVLGASLAAAGGPVSVAKNSTGLYPAVTMGYSPHALSLSSCLLRSAPCTWGSRCRRMA